LSYRSIIGSRGTRVDEQVLYDLRIRELISEVLGRERDELLWSLFLEPLDSVDVALYRLNVFRDLMREDICAAVDEFVERVREAMDYLEMEKDAYEPHKLGLRLDAALKYIDALESFCNKLSSLGVESEGLKSFLRYVEGIIQSQGFKAMKESALEAKRARDRIRIRVRIAGDRIHAWRFDGGEDMAKMIEELFARFRSGEVREVKYIPMGSSLSHIHAAILEGAFKFFKSEYEAMKKFYEGFPKIVDDGIASFIREVRFYLLYIKFVKGLMSQGYSFTIPRFVDDGRIDVRGFYSILLTKKGRVVPNDIFTEGSKRVFVVTGMNGGGKTTFATSFGQVAYLAKLGVPVPAESAELPFFTKIMAAYPAREDPRESLSRLEQDVVRAVNIMRRADSTTIVIANELFSTTTSDEGYQLARMFIEELNRRRSYCIFVTFIPGVASLDFVISLVAQPSPESPAKPSYKILPGPPPSEYMAVRIASRYGLTYRDLRERIR
jgi:DNA mismatch repair ATPase MutS